MKILMEGLDFMAQHQTIPAIWLSDFNTILDPSLDRAQQPASIPRPCASTRFARLIATFNLDDSWRTKHFNTRAYSCFSSTHDTMSHIDFILL